MPQATVTHIKQSGNSPGSSFAQVPTDLRSKHIIYSSYSLLHHRMSHLLYMHVRVRVCVCVCVCVGVCGHVYVVYEDTNLYNDMGMTGITRRR